MDKTNLKNVSEFIWLNGELIRTEEAKISILTHSLHYSGAVFEGEKAYSGKVFKLQEHTQRLINSARELRMEVPFTFEDIIEAHYELLQKNNTGDAYVRPLIWRGAESLNIVNKALSINLMIAVIPSFIRFDNGLHLHVSRWQKPHPSSMPPQCKSSGHYNMMILCKEEAKALGFDDAVLLDWRGYIAECCTSNIFFVKKDTLITPIPDTFLNGITRQTVIHLAKNLGLEVKEEYMMLEDIVDYDECFMTGTAAEIKTIASINLGTKKVLFEASEVTERLQLEYSKLVRA